MFNQDGVYYGITFEPNSLLVAMLILAGFLFFAIIISMMRIYKKAGMSSISAIIPIWSQINLFKIVEKPVWYVLLLFIPIVGIVINIQAYILLAKKFGKGTGFGIAIVFLPMIFIPLLSFYDYVGSNEKVEEEPIYNPFNQTNVEQVMPSSPIETVSDVQESENIQNVESETANSFVEPIMDSPVESVMDSVSQNQEDGLEIISTVENNVIMEEPIISELQNETVMPINNDLNQKLESDIPDIPVISEVPLEEVAISESVSQPSFMESVPVGIPVGNVSLSNEVESNINEISPVSNESVINQDIQTVISQKPEEIKDVAFGTSPIMGIDNLTNALNANRNDEVQNLDIIDNVKQTNTEENVTNDALEDIEMPEIAAKTCPACGISLSADTKVCTSCGIEV